MKDLISHGFCFYAEFVDFFTFKESPFQYEYASIVGELQALLFVPSDALVDKGGEV